MGKQKQMIKFGSKGEDHNSLEGFLQVHHFAQQARQDKVSNRGKTSTKHNSFQGGGRQLKNAPFKSTATTTSQLNESGTGSGGNLPLTATNLNTTTLSGSERDV